MTKVTDMYDIYHVSARDKDFFGINLRVGKLGRLTRQVDKNRRSLAGSRSKRESAA